MKYYKYDYQIINQKSFLINIFLNKYRSKSLKLQRSFYVSQIQ